MGALALWTSRYTVLLVSESPPQEDFRQVEKRRQLGNVSVGVWLRMAFFYAYWYLLRLTASRPAVTNSAASSATATESHMPSVPSANGSSSTDATWNSSVR